VGVIAWSVLTLFLHPELRHSAAGAAIFDADRRMAGQFTGSWGCWESSSTSGHAAGMTARNRWRRFIARLKQRSEESAEGRGGVVIYSLLLTGV